MKVSVYKNHNEAKVLGVLWEHSRCHQYISQLLLRYALWGDHTKTKRRR